MGMKYQTPEAPSWAHARWLISRGSDTIAYGDVSGVVGGVHKIQHWSCTFARIDGMVTPLMRVDGIDWNVGTYATMHDALAFTWDVLDVATTAAGKGV